MILPAGGPGRAWDVQDTARTRRRSPSETNCPGCSTTRSPGLTPDRTSAIDFAETKDGIEITVELPGLTKKDIHLAVEDDVLTVSGEKRAEKKQEGKDFRFVERRFGAFSRSISLPRGIDAGQIKAEMRDGLLKVTAPRPGHGDGNKVEVTIA